MRRLVCDLSWLLFRSYYSFGFMSSTLPSGYEKPTGHIFGVLSSLQEWLKKYPEDQVYLCEDGRCRLKELNQDYKAGRAQLEYPIFQDRDLIEALATMHPNVHVVFNVDEEADHVMYSLAKEFESNGDQVVIFSGDNDLLQAMTPNISVYRGVDKDGERWIDINTLKTDEKLLKKFHGVEPCKLPVFRALCGDSSDNLKGYERFPRELAALIAENFDYNLPGSDVDRFKDAFSRIPSVKDSWRKHADAVISDVARFSSNLIIMRLYTVNLSYKEYSNHHTEALTELRLSKWRAFINESR